MKITTFIILYFIILSCNSQKITKTDYKLINIVVDSLVRQSRKDTIGLRTETLNSRLSKERVLNSGFLYNKDGKYINQCPGNEIGDSLYKKFDYEKFHKQTQLLDTSKINNTNVVYKFTLKKQRYIDQANDFFNSNPKLNKNEIEEYFWMFERNINIQAISTPIYSDNKKIGIILVKLHSNGLQSWQFRKNDGGEWYIFCIKQIEFE